MARSEQAKSRSRSRRESRSRSWSAREAREA